MKEERNKPGRGNHRSGKLAFVYRAEQFLKAGSKAHSLAAFSEVYIKDPAGASLVKEMILKLNEALPGQPEVNDISELDDEIPEDMRREIIHKVITNHKGTSKAPRPGTGIREMQAYIDVQEELRRTNAEMLKEREERLKEREEAAREKAEQQAMMKEITERLRALEEKEAQHGANSGNAGSDD